ncbi:MAG: ParB N-terminal domain-containing protein [Bryobacterales bacterium]|nr:ParB N-terminal domain-containing protein [Bryobacterales bacterium]
MKHSLRIVEFPCDRIRIGERHRKDMGDLDGLAVSIATVGLLHPPVITEDGLLICGERRLLAMRDILGWRTIPVIVLEVSSIVEGECAENEIRKDFTPSERVAIAKALEAEIGKRQGQRTDKELPPDSAEVARGVETRDVAAKKAGFGGHSTYEQAKKVVEKAVDEVIAQMDTGDLSISAAAVIAEQPPEQQREIAQLPEDERKAAVRKLRRKDLPSTNEARRQAQETGKAILDRNLMYQLPVTEKQRPLVEQNYAAMEIVDAITALARCQHSAADISAAIRRLDTPDMDFAGRCVAAALFLNELNQELNPNGHQ